VRNIPKGAEPSSLTEHHAQQSADYDNYPGKDDLRASLAREQRGLCCYCMGRVRPDKDSMKIEHWRSQSRFPDHQLIYQNLLGACYGGEGLPEKQQHCDTHKRDSDLSKNPANVLHNVELHIQYDPDGTIRSTDPSLDKEINEVLNLNNAVRLKNNRKAVLDGFLDARKRQGSWSREILEKWLFEWTGQADDKDLKPYCQVVVYWLRRRLKRAR
jgi:uncharacterized protein (TIGR02646 family)